MGLCGAYNANVIKETTNIINEENNVEVIALGSKVINKLKYEKINIGHEISNLGSTDEYEIAKEVVEIISKKHQEKEINKIKIVYTKYVNPIRQDVEVLDLLDLEIPKAPTNKMLLIEPSEEVVFKQLLKQYFYSMVYSAILQSFASEHSYRRNSMDTANKNSLDLIQELDLEMNRIRQAMITQEISEIVGGSEALKS
jgi:F-type H+-transporting ATPase subunit gamma